MSRKLLGLSAGIVGAAAAVVLGASLAQAAEAPGTDGTRVTSEQQLSADCADMRDMTCLNASW